MMELDNLVKIRHVIKGILFIILLLSMSCNFKKKNFISSVTDNYSDLFTDPFLEKKYILNYEYWFVKDSIFARNTDIFKKGCNHQILLGVVGKEILVNGIITDINLCNDFYFAMYHSKTILSNGCITSELSTIEPMSHSLPDSVLPIQARIIEFDEQKKIKNLNQVSKHKFAGIVGFGW